MESDINGITNCCNVYIVNQNDNYWRKNLWKKQNLFMETTIDGQFTYLRDVLRVR